MTVGRWWDLNLGGLLIGLPMALLVLRGSRSGLAKWELLDLPILWLLLELLNAIYGLDG